MSFIPATAASQSVPRTIELPLADDYDAKKGALLIVTSGEYEECGADPDAVAAVAVSAGGPNTDGFSMLGTHEFPPGKMQAYAVEGRQLFRARYIGTLPSVPGASYGVVRDTDDFWKVDFSDTTNLVVKLEQILNVSPENVPEVIVSFLPDVALTITHPE